MVTQQLGDQQRRLEQLRAWLDRADLKREDVDINILALLIEILDAVDTVLRHATFGADDRAEAIGVAYLLREVQRAAYHAVHRTLNQLPNLAADDSAPTPLQVLMSTPPYSEREAARRAIDASRRQQILAATNAAYAALKSNPEAWNNLLAEQEVFDAALADGLGDD